ncbi:hypothetical protein CLOM_g22643 [Closterium sp. NIES-68]|nr:hypothetical protein CLOM_g22643 [Closterium sp. NIES-68]
MTALQDAMALGLARCSGGGGPSGCRRTNGATRAREHEGTRVAAASSSGSASPKMTALDLLRRKSPAPPSVVLPPLPTLVLTPAPLAPAPLAPAAVAPPAPAFPAPAALSAPLFSPSGPAPHRLGLRQGLGRGKGLRFSQTSFRDTGEGGECAAAAAAAASAGAAGAGAAGAGAAAGASAAAAGPAMTGGAMAADGVASADESEGEGVLEEFGSGSGGLQGVGLAVERGGVGSERQRPSMEGSQVGQPRRRESSSSNSSSSSSSSSRKRRCSRRSRRSRGRSRSSLGRHLRQAENSKMEHAWLPSQMLALLVVMLLLMLVLVLVLVLMLVLVLNAGKGRGRSVCGRGTVEDGKEEADEERGEAEREGEEGGMAKETESKEEWGQSGVDTWQRVEEEESFMRSPHAHTGRFFARALAHSPPAAAALTRAHTQTWKQTQQLQQQQDKGVCAAAGPVDSTPTAAAPSSVRLHTKPTADGLTSAPFTRVRGRGRRAWGRGVEIGAEESSLRREGGGQEAEADGVRAEEGGVRRRGRRRRSGRVKDEEYCWDTAEGNAEEEEEDEGEEKEEMWVVDEEVDEEEEEEEYEEEEYEEDEYEEADNEEEEEEAEEEEGGVGSFGLGNGGGDGDRRAYERRGMDAGEGERAGDGMGGGEGREGDMQRDLRHRSREQRGRYGCAETYPHGRVGGGLGAAGVAAESGGGEEESEYARGMWFGRFGGTWLNWRLGYHGWASGLGGGTGERRGGGP